MSTSRLTVTNLSSVVPSMPPLRNASEPTLGAMLTTAADLQNIHGKLYEGLGGTVSFGPAAQLTYAAYQQCPSVAHVSPKLQEFASEIWQYRCGMRASAGVWIDEQGQCAALNVQLSPFDRPGCPLFVRRGEITRSADAWVRLIPFGNNYIPLSIEMGSQPNTERASVLSRWYDHASYQQVRDIAGQILSRPEFRAARAALKSMPTYPAAIKFIEEEEKKVSIPKGVDCDILDGGALLFLNYKRGSSSDAAERIFQWIVAVPEGVQLLIPPKILGPGLYGLDKGEYLVRGGATLYHINGTKVKSVGRLTL